MNKFRKTNQVFNPLPAADDPPSFQRYQHDPYFGSTAKNHLIRLSPEMTQAMTGDKSLRQTIRVLLDPAKKHLVG